VLGAALVAILGAGFGPGAQAAPQARTAGPETQASRLRLESPYHGTLDGIAFGGYGELRFAEDREAGVSDPEWFSVGGVNGFLFARLSPRIDLSGQAGWDRGADDFTLERAEAGFRVSGSTQAHAGIFLAPLGRTNLSHDAPAYDFAERSLVATQLIGVPHAQLGIGVRKAVPTGNGLGFSYEVDLVTGYDEGLILDSPGGTRVPRGRNNYGDTNGIPALAWRVALEPAAGKEFGLAAQSGPYNKTELNGVRVDDSRWVHVVVGDATLPLGGFRVFGEAAYAAIDVPPGLRSLFAEQQCGGSVEVVRTLFEPLLRSWRGSCLTLGVRADAVDFDRAIQGDSRSRLSTSLNVYSRPQAVTRFGWYYEIRRDRFNNTTPLAGLTFTAATYF
jgi:hypothetical protein